MSSTTALAGRGTTNPGTPLAWGHGEIVRREGQTEQDRVPEQFHDQEEPEAMAAALVVDPVVAENKPSSGRVGVLLLFTY